MMKYLKFTLVLLALLLIPAHAVFAGEENLLLKKDGYVSGFSKADRKKKSGKILLEIYKPYVENLIRAGLPNLNKTEILGVEYDEIWERKRIEYLSKEEIEQYKNDLQLIIVYMKKGKIQACVVESKLTGNPLTGQIFDKPEYKIISLENRDEIMSNY